ncbi:unnamed protein product [Brachionus calyciflorus]|uniref:Mitochondrial fission process protein 1 n=1 Tax=Brachionus calyciflorus TaxID=104777 RepID=A0A814GC87_9BILA|nr:unnamed protein product [Brachionus calyciflorus]
MVSKTDELDIFRDTPVRYMGYANEIGEAFRSMISPAAVRATYGVAFGYVFLDVIDKANKTFKKETKLAELSTPKESPKSKTAKIATDCLIWQSFASVIIPGFTINRICKLSSYLLSKTSASPKAGKILTTLIGLGSIPFIIHPIDHGCHIVMDKTIRPYLGIDPHVITE